MPPNHAPLPWSPYHGPSIIRGIPIQEKWSKLLKPYRAYHRIVFWNRFLNIAHV